MTSNVKTICAKDRFGNIKEFELNDPLQGVNMEAVKALGISEEQYVQQYKATEEQSIEKWVHRVENHEADILVEKFYALLGYRVVGVSLSGIALKELDIIVNPYHHIVEGKDVRAVVAKAQFPSLRRRAQELLELLKHNV